MVDIRDCRTDNPDFPDTVDNLRKVAAAPRAFRRAGGWQQCGPFFLPVQEAARRR